MARSFIVQQIKNVEENLLDVNFLLQNAGNEWNEIEETRRFLGPKPSAYLSVLLHSAGF